MKKTDKLTGQNFCFPPSYVCVCCSGDVLKKVSLPILFFLSHFHFHMCVLQWRRWLYVRAGDCEQVKILHFCLLFFNSCFYWLTDDYDDENYDEYDNWKMMMHRRGGGTVRRGRADQRGHQVVFVWTMIMMTKMVILMMMISMGVILR